MNQIDPKLLHNKQPKTAKMTKSNPNLSKLAQNYCKTAQISENVRKLPKKAHNVQKNLEITEITLN